MAFDPNKYIRDIKGQRYLEVKWRLMWFREDHPTWGIRTSIHSMDKDMAVVQCIITAEEKGSEKAAVLSSGFGACALKDAGKVSGRYLEKAETAAVGRALAHLGYGTQFASELNEDDHIADAPIPAKKKGEGQAPVVINAAVVATARAELAALTTAVEVDDWRIRWSFLTTDEKMLLSVDFLAAKEKYGVV